MGTLGTLFIGETGDNILAREEVGDFGISNNGKYIAFTTGDTVCISQPATANNAPTCVDRFWDRGKLDVADNGDVWLTGDSTTNCPGKQYVDLPTFTCDAIFTWNGNQRAPQLVAFAYVDPFGVPLPMGQRIMALANNWKRKG